MASAYSVLTLIKCHFWTEVFLVFDQFTWKYAEEAVLPTALPLLELILSSYVAFRIVFIL